MDDDVKMFLEQLNARLLAIEAELKKLHSPGDCPVNERVHKIELREARQQGMIVIIGSIAGMIAAAILSALSTMWKR